MPPDTPAYLRVQYIAKKPTALQQAAMPRRFPLGPRMRCPQQVANDGALGAMDDLRIMDGILAMGRERCRPSQLMRKLETFAEHLGRIQ